MELEVRRQLQTPKRVAYICTHLKNSGSRQRICGMYRFIFGRNKWSSNAGWACDFIRITEVERA